PYFVAGAIHSGLAMVITLLIPLRRVFRLERLVQIRHFEAMAQLNLLTGLIVLYAYTVEPFIAWYTGDANSTVPWRIPDINFTSDRHK
ncbi:MAG TPA: hypothetical protein PK562_07850, partial [Candidatus Omnitrophota bacterium]|nr:hypothetical protein [Candidatus Omnitrophota bacterium]